jgi:hypothetical protein
MKLAHVMPEANSAPNALGAEVRRKARGKGCDRSQVVDKVMPLSGVIGRMGVGHGEPARRILHVSMQA